jgi:signal transduction histidine kinase
MSRGQPRAPESLEALWRPCWCWHWQELRPPSRASRLRTLREPHVPRLARMRRRGTASGARRCSRVNRTAGSKLIYDLAAQAGLVLRNVRLIEELRASRQRIVSAQDARAKTLERNIHDGAQQQLVALKVKLGLVQRMVEQDPVRAQSLLSDLQVEAGEALEGLRDLARGIYPPLLADRGLFEALSAQARKSPLPVDVQGNGIVRYAQDAEAAIYFCCLEALQNAAKYSEATRVLVRLSSEAGAVRFTVQDDGAGFDPSRTPRGAGLQNMADRLEALGGTLEVSSRPGDGTAVTGRIPTPGLPNASSEDMASEKSRT